MQCARHPLQDNIIVVFLSFDPLLILEFHLDINPKSEPSFPIKVICLNLWDTPPMGRRGEPIL